MSAWLEGHPGLPRVLAGVDNSPMTMAQHAAIHGPMPQLHAVNPSLSLTAPTSAEGGT